jgi:iron complex outermembrane receptor protein
MNRKFALRSSTWMIMTAIAGQAWAEEAAYNLDEVVVSATRPGYRSLSASKVNPERVSALTPATSDTATLLRDVPGVSLYGAGGVSSLPVIHGLADDRVRTLVDGMDLIAACPNHMNSALSYIDPTAVESIQVYAGVTPVSVGGDSLGGSIVVTSARPDFAQPGAGVLKTGEVGGFYRSNGDGRGLNAKVTLASESLSLSYTGAKAKSDNYDAAENFKDNLYANPANAPYTGRAGHTLPLDEVGSTAFDSTNQMLGLAWRSGAHLVDLKLSHQNIPFENYPNQRMDMTGNESDKINLGYEGLFGWGKLKARAYWESTDHEMDFGVDKRYWYGPDSNTEGAATPAAAINPTDCGVMDAGCAHGMPMYTKSKTLGLKVNGEIAMASGSTVRLGGEFQSYDLEDWWPASGAGMWPYTFLNLHDGERDRFSLFSEWETRLADKWTGLFGLRHDIVRMDAGDVHGYNLDTFPTVVAASPGNQTRDAALFNNADHDITDRNWDFTALGRYAPSATSAYEIGLAQKIRSPNLYERYPWSTWQMAALMNNFVGDGNGYVGNLDLEPEVAHTLSFVADWHAVDKKAWGVRVAPYYTRVKDYVDAVQWNAATNTPATTATTGSFVVLKYANHSARLLGLDLSGYRQLASGTGYGDFTLNGQMSWIDGENRDTGDNLYNIMPLNAKLALTQTWGGWTNILEGVFVAGKDDVSAVRNEIETGGYSLVNLRASRQWKQLRLDLGVENLFDKAYDIPLGGAYVGQGTTMTLGPVGVVPQWGTAVPGPGRSLYVGMNYTF